jgi:hypothetical protein
LDYKVRGEAPYEPHYHIKGTEPFGKPVGFLMTAILQKLRFISFFFLYTTIMISCVLSGGLGNQLFQLFTTIAYHIQHGTPFLFSRKKMTKNDHRPMYWLSLFDTIDPLYIVDTSVFQNWNTYVDPAHTYTPIPSFGGDVDTLLSGAFQCYSYFDNYKSNILSILDLDTKRTIVKNDYMQFSPNSINISMHFRMGDYKKFRCYHPVLPWQYYVDALRHILLEIGSTSKPVFVHYFFEKEDIRFVNQYLSHIQQACPNCYYVPVLHIPTDWEEMLAMSCCDHHIIANSTFSWWGAYLHNDNTAVTCYPQIWYGHQLYYINTRDMCLPSWKMISIDLSKVRVPCNCNL